MSINISDLEEALYWYNQYQADPANDEALLAGSKSLESSKLSEQYAAEYAAWETQQDYYHHAYLECDRYAY